MTAKELSKYIITEIKARMTDVSPDEFDVTPLKLQKLLYYCQGYSLALTGKTAFTDKIEAWDNGPVVENVYQEYKKYSGGIIPHQDIECHIEPSEQLKSIVSLVLADKMQYSGAALARATHKERPYRESYRPPYHSIYRNAEIPTAKIKDYFSEELTRREEDYGDVDEAWDSLAEPMSISELEALIEEL